MIVLAWTWPLSFDEPQWLWLCLLVPVLVVASLRSLAGLDPVRRVLALLARAAVVVALALCLAGVQSIRTNDDLTVLFLMDRSHSVEQMQDEQEEYMRIVTKDIPKEDRVGVIDFARHAYLQQLPMRGGYFIAPGRLPQMPNSDRTDVAAALRLAMAMFPHDTAKRIVLMSDGNDNMGDVITEARRAKADGIPIDILPMWYRHRNEVYFERMLAPTFASEGEQVPIRMVINTNKPIQGTLAIYQNGKLVNMPPEQSHVSLEAGSNSFFVKLPVTSSGAQRYEAVFRPDDDAMDAIPFNNTASAFSFVSGSSKVLLVTADREYDAVLASALRSEKIDVEMKTVSELGAFDLLDMSNYASILLANIPAASFTDAQHEALATYVKEGSGLIMLGGDEGFGAGGWIGTPVEEVMPVSFEIKHKRVIPRGALVLILHSCEMPRGNYWGKEMAKKSVDTISSQDYLGVIAYTYSPGGVNWEVPLDVCTNKAAVKAKINRTQIGDMPDFGTAMKLAYDALTGGRGKDAAQKHMIIISDGDPQPPSAKLLADFKRAKITVSTIGIGWGAHVMRGTMERIAKATGGKFYAPKNARALPQIFVKESKVVRRPLIIDEPFVPQVYHADSALLTRGFGEAIPPLGGMVMTSPKPSPNVQMPLVRATDDGDDPVLVHWQYELGKAVAFTSGYWPRWGQDWTQWPKYSKLWAQIVRWSMRQEAPANFDTFTKIEGNRARIVVDALDKDASYLNNIQFVARLIGPDNKATELDFRQTGPGHYEAEFPVEKAGQYLANLHVFEGGKHYGTVRTGLTVPFSPEYRDLTTNEPLLRQIQDISAGRWFEGDPEEHDVFAHNLPLSVARQPVWEWVLAWLLLPLFLLDVAVRRLASWLALSIATEIVVLVVLLFGFGFWPGVGGSWWGILGAVLLAELIGWIIRFQSIGPLFQFLTHGVTALAQTGDRSAVALDQLKGVRDRTREELAGQEDVAYTRIAQTPEPTTARPSQAKRRFDVGDTEANEPAQDLHDALGGARTAREWKEKHRKPADAGDEQQDQEDMTSRLLRAKRRARKNVDDKGDSPKD